MISSAVRLSVVVPAYNEEDRLPASLVELRRYLGGASGGYELLVVDDGSADGTAALVTAASAGWPELRLLRLPRNQGKGAAVREGMLRAVGRRRLFTDADLSTPIEEVAKLRARLDPGTQVVIGSRALPDSDVEVHQPWYREAMGRGYNRLLQWLVLPGLRDTQCGFKLFTATAAQSCFAELHCPGFGFDAEVLLHASASGLRVAEVGVSWRNSCGTRVSPFNDSWRMLAELWRLRRLRGSLVPLPEHT
jgi:dolichyl-phosphate beta-glucosyltransferase